MIPARGGAVMLALVAEVAWATDTADTGDTDAGADPDAGGMRTWLLSQRSPGGVPRGHEIAAATDAFLALPPLLPDDASTWVAIGPAPLRTDTGFAPMPKAGPAAGRASAMAFDPTDPDVMYAGFAIGGVWKTTDGAATWSHIGDAIPSGAIGSIAVDPEDPATVWVGTGEDALWAGNGGRGLFVSHDAGASFTHVGDDRWDEDAISRIVIDDATGDVYVGVAFGIHGWDGFCEVDSNGGSDHGLFVTSDEGATFTRLHGGDVTDFDIDEATTPRTFFVGDYDTGIWRSTDDGAHWTQPTGLPARPQNLQIGLSGDPSLIYAAGGVSYSKGGAFRSFDGGRSFEAIPGAPDYGYDQCYFQNAVTVDPADPGVLYLGGGLCAVWKLDDAGGPAPVVTTDSCARNWWQSKVHPDVHDLVFDGTGALWSLNDGGLAVSTDGATTWTRPVDGISAIQMYGVCVDPNDPIATYAGAQDNGTMRRTADGWEGVTTGDGGPCAVDSGDGRVVLVSAQYAAITRSDRKFDGGQYAYTFDAEGTRAPFIAPLVADPSTHHRFYVGTYRLLRSDDGGRTWDAISDDLTAGTGQPACFGEGGRQDDVLSAIAVAPSDANTLYTGSEAGEIAYSHDGGATWTHTGRAGVLPPRWVTSLAVDAVDANVVYAGFSAYDADTPDAPGHVFRSDDGGVTWVALAIPVDLPVDSLAAHPIGAGVVYAGTDAGVLVSADRGATWDRLGTGLPPVPAYSLAFRDVTASVVVGTYGRGAWEMALGTGDVAVEPSAVTLNARKKEASDVAHVAVRNLEGTGSMPSFTVSSPDAWLAITPTEGVAAGLAPVDLAVSADPQLHRGEQDGTIVITVDNGQSFTVPVHLIVKHRGCGCDDSGGVGGWLGVLVGLVGVIGKRRGQRVGSVAAA